MQAGRIKRVLCTGGSGFIGSHFVSDLLVNPDIAAVMNIDTAPPERVDQRDVWKQVDILDKEHLADAFHEFQPTHVVHLAARTTMEGKSIEDYPENVQGTENVLSAVRESASVKFVVVTSSQHVRRPGSRPPRSDTDYDPYEAYGQSKVATEKLARSANLRCGWVIIRPTTVWGPGSRVFAKGLWGAIARGLYVHPNKDAVVRGYGYVKNVVFQLAKLIGSHGHEAHGRVLYVGDECIAQVDWVNAFSVALTGRSVRLAPREVLLLAALAGELGMICGLRPPLYLARYKNMTTSNRVPMEDALALLGRGPYSLTDGVKETVAWLHEQGLVESNRLYNRES